MALPSPIAASTPVAFDRNANAQNQIREALVQTVQHYAVQYRLRSEVFIIINLVALVGTPIPSATVESYTPYHLKTVYLAGDV